MFSSKSFIVSGLTFRSLIDNECMALRKCYNFTSLHEFSCLVSSAPLIEELFLPHHIFLPPLSKIRYP